jgi:hypothetical protein
MRAGRRPAYVAPRATTVARSLFERRAHAARGWNRFGLRRVMRRRSETSRRARRAT